MSKASCAPAAILAIGTSVPPNVVEQSSYPDFLFNVTNSNHNVQLKDKFKRICDRSGVEKRHLYLTKEILEDNPKMCIHLGTSYNARQAMLASEIPKLAKEAAVKAINEWGGHVSNVTHLVMASMGGDTMPGADASLHKLLGLGADVRRLMISNQGCFAGGSAMRIAKDIAENNTGARILVVCAEMTIQKFRPPSEGYPSALVGGALLADGAAALIVGCNPTPLENTLFEVHWSGQKLVPRTDHIIHAQLTEAGLMYHLDRDVPGMVANNVGKAVYEALNHAYGGFEMPSTYSELFWAVHPGGPAVLDQVESKLNIDKERMQASRDVLANYGNMSSASVLFILDRLRKRSLELGSKTTGEGLEWGIVAAFGPGITIECLLLRSMPCP